MLDTLEATPVSVVGTDGRTHTVISLTETNARCSCGATVAAETPISVRLLIWSHLNQ